MLLNATLVGDRQLIARAAAWPAAVGESLRKRVQILTLKLQAKIVGEKLSGQVLGVRTGDLRRSIQQRVEATGLTVFGFVFSSGDVKYARFWEYGFQGSVNVKAYSRTSSSAFGKTVPTYTAQVTAHSRQVNQAARPYMRPSLAEMGDEIRTGLVEAAKAGLIQRTMG